MQLTTMQKQALRDLKQAPMAAHEFERRYRGRVRRALLRQGLVERSATDIIQAAGFLSRTDLWDQL